MAGQISGSDIAVALYHESTYGADPGSPVGRKAYLTSLGVAYDQALIEDPTLSGGRGRREPGLGNVNVAGPAAATIAPETIGFWLAHLLGTPTTTGSSSPYTHTFRPKALPVGFRIEKDYTSKVSSKVEAFKGMRISSAELSFVQDGPATISMQLMGKDHAIITAPLDATLDDPGHGMWTGFDGIVKIGGTQSGIVQSITVRVDNTMPGGPYCFPGSGVTAGTRRSNPEGICSISGSTTLVFEDFDLFDLAKAGTDTNFEVILTSGTGAGTVGNEQLSVKVDHCRITPASPPLDTSSGMIITVQFGGFASGSTDMGLVCVLKNAISGANL